jgi:cold shock CspA family protein
VGGGVPSSGAHVGHVAAFDATRGLGSVEDADDGSSYTFHATAIADGSRRISAGTAVVFAVRPGHGGRYEARSLRPVSA